MKIDDERQADIEADRRVRFILQRDAFKNAVRTILDITQRIPAAILAEQTEDDLPGEDYETAIARLKKVRDEL
jgi:hypothetical protein